ncbi:MAG: pyridoxal phosphate-dependent aminotransferase [Bacteroidaceae bacterium]|nr:pyridoxal phosphate-dependent aminotransferase [Bacteroidaceae bacterium]
MKYDFDTPVNRRRSACMKWDEDPSVDLPLWVADMDFRACPAIREALEERLAHGVFGYAMPDDAFYKAILHWHSTRHNVQYCRDWIITVPGIVPAISAILRALTQPGNGVLTLSPVYNCFYSSIRNLGCRAEESVLRREGNTFHIDFDDLEQRAAKPDVKVLLLCSPHNPSGRVWSKEELRMIGDICLRNNVFVVSDEIHCELTMPGHHFLPYASLGEKYMAQACICTSASKAFNIAGLQNAQIIVPNAEYRQRIDRAVNIHEVCDVNPFGIVATTAAYTHGADWLDALCQYIWSNYEEARHYIESRLPMLGVSQLQGTYLMWVDVSDVTEDVEDFCNRLRNEQHLWFAAGSHYGKGGEGFVRINLATQRENVLRAMERLESFIIH